MDWAYEPIFANTRSFGMLFREQVVASQQRRLHGTISLAQPLPLSLFVGFFALSILIASLFFLTFDYARKATVSGYLKPDLGVINIYNSRNALLKELLIKEGEEVTEGQVVALMQLNRGLSDGSELSEHLLSELKQQLDTLEQEYRHTKQLGEQELDDRKMQIADNQTLVATLQRRLQLAQQAIELQQEELTKIKALKEQRFFTESALRDEIRQLLDRQQQAETIAAQIDTLQIDIKRWQRDLKAHPINTQLALANIAKQISTTRLKISEAKNQFQFALKAPQSGTVSNIMLETGQFVTSDTHLITLLPNHAQLVAELLVPSRSIGQIEVGDQVRLRFDAFPYQRFGFMSARVTSIDKTITPARHPSLKLPTTEPVYRVQAELNEQNFTSGDKTLLLKSGMQLQADIILEKRSIAGWLLDPLISLIGRIG
ncbi:TPA: HlyD family efflux transporter periplasmic adaptor subunit [Vibrio vulnificus]|nr:HlyD family efflux transporter periplasmic adaptor subunit [Vibrio vulnificus]